MKYIYLKDTNGKIIGHLQVDEDRDISIIKSFINGYLCRDDLVLNEEGLTNLFEALLEKNYIFEYYFNFNAEHLCFDVEEE